MVGTNYRQTTTLNWSMTERQFRVFEAWHRRYLHDGISRFAVNWNGRSGWVQFTGEVQCQLAGATWSVSGEVMIDYAYA